jgi:hypothetical protein
VCYNNCVALDERAFFQESRTTKPATLNCPSCRTFAKFLSYMVLLDDKAMCKNMRCRKRFDISGVKTTAFI